MSEPTKAVFLSYAREDADAARRIADALRGFGVEVWFDQSELRGGDTWDAKIKKQIRECALFLPLVSAQTQERTEGYFRREWLLAVERTRDMAAGRAFVVPVVIDDTPEADAAVPDEFMRYQWTRLPNGEPTPDFVAQVKQLLDTRRKPALKAEQPRPPAFRPNTASAGRSSSGGAGVGDPGPAAARPATTQAVPGWLWGVLAVVLIGVAVGVILLRSPSSAPLAPVAVSAREPKPATGVAAKDDTKSIAVLPFANLSTDKENEFFADGVHDDVITSLAKIRDLKVISRTSVLAYRDASARNLKKIAAELGVATVLEGSVRRVGTKVHMNAQLIDARTDEHLWAETYDGDTTDIFALQAKLAQQIASALKATLTPGERTLIERRPTQNQVAYDLYLRARTMHQERGESDTIAGYEHIIAVYEQAIAQDPAFAQAQAQVSLVHSVMYWFGYLDPTPARAARMKAAVDAAVRLAPDAPETHLALGAYYYRVIRDWNRALAEFRAAEAGLPNDAQLMFWLALTHRRLGKWTEALGYFEHSVALNPRDASPVSNYIGFLVVLRHWAQTRTAAARFLTYFPNDRGLLISQAAARFALDGDRAAFARTFTGLPRPPEDPAGDEDRYRAACLRGDYPAADQALANAQLASFPEWNHSVINDPVVFRRAYLAFLRGDSAVARGYADQAIGYYLESTWNQRQQPWVQMRIALAEAWAGRPAEASRDAQLAMAEATARDSFDAVNLRGYLGEIYVSLGQREEAFACLRQMMREPFSLSPNEIRIDPIWSRLKDDPRFEEILKSAKPL